MRETNITLEIFSIIVTLVILSALFAYKESKTKLGKLFIAMLVVNILVLASDLLTFIFNARGDLRVFLTIANFFVYSFGYVIVAIFTAYLICFIEQKKKLRYSKVFLYVIFALCGVAVLLVFISLFTGIYYNFNENGIYVRGDYFWFSQAFPLLMIAVNMFVILLNSKKLKLADTLVLLSYCVFPVIAMIVQIAVYGITLLYLATTLSMLIIYIYIQGQQRRLLKEKEAELLESKTALMISQIQPHFLYNALNTIQYLCVTDSKAASDAIQNFSKYLRKNMNSLTCKDPISLENELEHLKSYLNIEKLRFPDITIDYDIKEKNIVLPPLTIQPLVENAIHHGVRKLEGDGRVMIATWKDAKNKYVMLADNGVGFDPLKYNDDGKNHVGIKNVMQRVSAMCNGEMKIESQIGNGTKITIILPIGNDE